VILSKSDSRLKKSCNSLELALDIYSKNDFRIAGESILRVQRELLQKKNKLSDELKAITKEIEEVDKYVATLLSKSVDYSEKELSYYLM
jgi:hypothetical protein